MRLSKNYPFMQFISNFGFFYLSPINLNYYYSFGVFALYFLVIQIVTGILLAMHYIPSADLAFLSVDHIMREVNYGWLLRYSHSNGASMFFLCVYLHMARAFIYSSFVYPREALWNIGVVIFLIMILTAFLGYVLPWGQMSFWAATVITSLVSAIPIIGIDLLIWIWSGFSVGGPTLNKFFSLHFFFPFIILALTFAHLSSLHQTHSNNPLGTEVFFDNTSLIPFFGIKDTFAIICVTIIFEFLIFFEPNLLGHSDNFIPANPMVTPTHIVPEWYFLPFYAVLRCIPNKLGGFCGLISVIIALFILPFFLKITFRLTELSDSRHFFSIFLFFSWLTLGRLGGKPVAFPYYQSAQIFTILFFLVLFVFNFYSEKRTKLLNN